MNWAAVLAFDTAVVGACLIAGLQRPMSDLPVSALALAVTIAPFIQFYAMGIKFKGSVIWVAWMAAAALYRLGGAPAAIAWLLAPTAVFTMVPYTESVFCAAAFWAWERATAKQWGAAAVLAAVAAAVRVSGVFLIVALAVLAITSAGSSRDKGKRLLWLLFPLCVVVAYLAYLYSMTGNWAAWYEAQAAGWSRGFTWPWDSLRHTFEAFAPGAYADHPEWAWVFRAEVVSMAVGVVVTLASLVRRRWGEATWVGLQVAAFSVSYWFMSVNRAVLLWFPLWTWLGELGGSRRKLPTWRAILT